MFTSKERSNLKALASTLEPICQVGKSGVSENMTESLSKALDARELIKVSVLQNAEMTPEEYAEELASALDAEVVCVIGKKIVLYRYSKKEHVKHVRF